MKESNKKSFWKNLNDPDRKIIKWFLFWLILLNAFQLLNIILLWGGSFNPFIPSILSTLVNVFFLTGLLIFKYHHKTRIMPTKKLFGLFAKLGLVMALIITVIFHFLFLLQPSAIRGFAGISANIASMNILQFLLSIFFVFVVFFLIIFIAQIFVMFVGFGAVGLLALVERANTAKVLVEVTKITENTNEELKKKAPVNYWGAIALRWLFDISKALDTRRFTFNRGLPLKEFPWQSFQTAMIWQLFFGIVVTINISFNPLLLEDFSFQELNQMASNISFLIPLIILPWFIFRRIGARIEGPVGDHELHKGLSTRTFRAIVAIGTLIIVIRLAARDISLQMILMSFLGYFVVFIIITFIYTFIYFNYFEDGIAQATVERFEELKANSSAEVIE